MQFTLPGAPTVYYGDEVGVTGDDDPDDRRTYPWPDLGGTPDNVLRSHYSQLSGIRRTAPALTAGDFRVLLANDAVGTVAYGRKTASQVAVIIVNRSGTPATGAIPVAGYIPDGVTLAPAYTVGSGGGAVTVSGGQLAGSIDANSAVVLLSGQADLMPPSAPSNLRVMNEGNTQIDLAWDAVEGAVGYNIYRSPLSGGGWVKANASPVSGTDFTDASLRNGQTHYYVVTALDGPGNESGWSNEVSALPHYTIGWANLQWPPSLTHTISAVNRTDNVYGQVWIGGVTDQPGPTPTLRAQLGFGPTGSNPAGNAAWIWVDASFNANAGNNDEFVASLLPEAIGSFDYVYRYTTTAGRDWLYADLSGPVPAGAAAIQSRQVDRDPRAATRRRPPSRPAHTWWRRHLRVSSWHGTRWPATPRSTATRCAAATPRAAPTRRWRSSPRTATWIPQSRKARRTTMWCGRWISRSTAQRIQRRSRRPRCCAR